MRKQNHSKQMLRKAKKKRERERERESCRLRARDPKKLVRILVVGRLTGVEQLFILA